MNMNKRLLLLALFALPLLTAATWPRFRPVPVKAPCLSPVLVGRITLGAGVGQVNDPRIHAGQIVIFSVNSPDSLSEGARVSVYQQDEGVLVFWAHTFNSQGSFPTEDEPEVHFSVWNSSGPGIWP